MAWKENTDEDYCKVITSEIKNNNAYICGCNIIACTNILKSSINASLFLQKNLTLQRKFQCKTNP